ncbi:MAG: hypothetical protein H7Y13_17020 [Sphingobacteriaceae bacterium]|nr:hypothetical protein [Sphingobacteriaceae bacterium]
MLTETLKLHTKLPHQELETPIIQQIQLLDTEAASLKFSTVFFYAYIAAFEQKLNSAVNGKNIIDYYFNRRKSRYLLQDLSDLGQSSGAISLAVNPSRILCQSRYLLYCGRG